VDLLGLDGTFSVTESWTATLTYTGWGDQNYRGTKKFTGTQKGTIVVSGDTFTLLDQTKLAHEAPDGVSTTRRLRFDRGGYSIDGGKVMPYILAGRDLYGVIYLGAFMVKVSLVDGEIPIFHRSESFYASGDSLASLSGSGEMTGPSITVSVTSTATWTPSKMAPSITDHPASQAVHVGTPVSFTTAAIGSPTLTYQWQKDGKDIAGAKAAIYSIASAQLTHNGQYRVVIKNSYGTATSLAATLTVNVPATPPSIVVQPQPVTTVLGHGATFTVEAAGTPPLTYEWFFNGQPIPGAASPTLALPHVNPQHSGKYSVRVTNSAGSAASAAAELKLASAEFTLGSLQKSQGDPFRCQIEAANARQVILEASADLRLWTPVSTNPVPAVGVLNLSDPGSAGRPHRFYRIQLAF
jgi:hypothetical protein